MVLGAVSPDHSAGVKRTSSRKSVQLCRDEVWNFELGREST